MKFVSLVVAQRNFPHFLPSGTSVVFEIKKNKSAPFALGITEIHNDSLCQ